MVWVRVQVPARATILPLLSLAEVEGFCCGAPPGAPAFCFPAVWGARFLGGAPGGLAGVSGGCSAFSFTCAVPSCVNAFVPVCVCSSLCGVLRDVESLACVLGRFRRESPRGARTARFSWVFGRYGGRVVLRGFCGAAIVVLSWLCPWLVARLQGRACFLK